jgi:RNA polymerase sigma-70 factor (ECF subfamily)
MQNSQDKDILLFNQIKKGNELAFNTLFEKYYRVLCEFSMMIVGNHQTAEEIVADVFASIWIKRGKHSVDTNLKGYLLRSTKNLTISYMRRKKIRILSIDEIEQHQPKSELTPDININKAESLNSTENILLSIPTKSRLVFKMHRFENLKYQEIANILDISIKSVEKHMGKSLKILRGLESKIALA